jgi:membrane associated rhomboid family serine protease
VITALCPCGVRLSLLETETNQDRPCACGRPHRAVSAEPLPEGAGGGDFDVGLEVVRGPTMAGQLLLLGGVPAIEIGKLPDRHIVLAGAQASRQHACLERLDFGPSRWKVVDRNSTNGVFVNGVRVAEQELKVGDAVRIGDYDFAVRATEPPPAPAPPKKPAGPTKACTACAQPIPAAAKICTQCGTDQRTGRKLVVSRGLDENQLAINADAIIRAVSWLVPFGLFPIASEAMGRHKPVATWVLAAVTLVASVAFYVAMQADEPAAATLNLMCWAGTAPPPAPPPAEVTPAEIDRQLREFVAETERRTGRKVNLTAEQREELRALLKEEAAAPPEDESGLPPGVGFRPYQLVTCAFLHDPGSVLGLIFHFAGNILFLLVFGLRVNEVLGWWRFLICYVALAAAAAWSHMLATAGGPPHPMLGASGVVMGLAGMYFVFFPTQKVHMAIWFRGGWITRFQCFYKLFQMRGFWLLVMWILWNDVLWMVIEHELGVSGGVAHWAHVGGFAAGVLLAVVALVSRQAKTFGGDLISLALGRHAGGLVAQAV